MSRWPWITTVIAVLVTANPVGQGFLYSAFLSNEQLSRNIAQPFVFLVMALLLALGALEWLIGWLLRRRRRTRSGAAPP